MSYVHSSTLLITPICSFIFFNLKTPLKQMLGVSGQGILSLF